MSPETSGTPDKESRILKLGEVQIHKPVNVLDPFLVVNWNRKTSTSTAAAAKLIADTSEVNEEGRSPTYLLVADSKKEPRDLIGMPTNKPSPHALSITWTDQGATVAVGMRNLLAARGVTIPRGTRMFISLYETEDADFGKVVGIRINSPIFKPIDYLTDEEKEARAQKKAEKEKAKQEAKAKAKEQAVAELPVTESAIEDGEAE